MGIEKLSKMTGTHFINRLYSAMCGQAAYLRGDAFGASFWTHPDHGAYWAWKQMFDPLFAGMKGMDPLA